MLGPLEQLAEWRHRARVNVFTLENPKEPIAVAWFGLDKLKAGLQKTRDKIGSSIKAVFQIGRKVDQEFLDEVEETLLTADIGPTATLEILDDLQAAYKSRKVRDADELYDYLKEDLKARLREWDTEVHFAAESPTVVMVAGVNGVGKTTSIAKLAKLYVDQGKKVLVAAADTFRAAAVEQLEIWSHRVGADIVKHQMGSDPGAVTYDAIDAAKARGVDVVIVDTAGRLHTRGNLMAELGKIRRVIEKNTAGGPHEVLLVLDATTGQNAIPQVREFRAAIDVTGLFLAKLDGTAKGGIVLGMKSEFDVPVKFVGLGEKSDDIAAFDPDAFVDAIFGD